MELVIASRNVHKIREIRSILKPKVKWDILSLLDFPSYLFPEERGNTFEENATAKALHASSSLEKWVLADDSGLVVPALNGAPGVRSARFAGIGATDRENRLKLLHQMQHLEDPHRQAYFECCLVFASPDGVKKTVRGICEGTITREERGSRGFGYDPIFMKYDYNKTFAELEEEIKNRVSHRRKALDKLMLLLESFSSIDTVSVS
jgi:XTP/dITP diphosphohydrolase